MLASGGREQMREAKRRPPHAQVVVAAKAADIDVAIRARAARRYRECIFHD